MSPLAPAPPRALGRGAHAQPPAGAPRCAAAPPTARRYVASRRPCGASPPPPPEDGTSPPGRAPPRAPPRRLPRAASPSAARHAGRDAPPPPRRSHEPARPTAHERPCAPYWSRWPSSARAATADAAADAAPRHATSCRRTPRSDGGARRGAGSSARCRARSARVPAAAPPARGSPAPSTGPGRRATRGPAAAATLRLRRHRRSLPLDAGWDPAAWWVPATRSASVAAPHCSPGAGADGPAGGHAAHPPAALPRRPRTRRLARLRALLAPPLLSQPRLHSALPPRALAALQTPPPGCESPPRTPPRP
mmetsp:Transcript_48030/g.159183  ORF Transcript_48030/g.159183 Transcript_48030/m.159183 type:complete len:307 (+) Transcript_48030:2745-3665(+)